MRIRIVSDGRGPRTHVFAVGDDGQKIPIHGVQAVEWAIDSPRGRGEAKLTVTADVNVEGELAEWRPVPRDPTLMGTEPGVPFWDALFLCLGVVAAVAVLLVERAL